MAAIGAAPAGRAEAPDWVTAFGESPRYPAERFVTGFGTASTDDKDPQASAKNRAAADLAMRLSVRIESDLRDLSAEKDGERTYHVAAVTRATTDLRLSGLRYEVHRAGDATYALAILERAPAARHRTAERDDTVARARACSKAGEDQRAAQQNAPALATFLECRLLFTSALEHGAVLRALTHGAQSDPVLDAELSDRLRQVDQQVRELLGRPMASLANLIDVLVVQLARQGAPREVTVSPLTYGTTDVSSPFGHHLASAVERGLARAGRTESGAGAWTLVGVYTPSAGAVEVTLTARHADGRLLAAAEGLVPETAIPVELPILPGNFERAMEAERILGPEEAISGALRIEVWTDKGRRRLVYAEREELKLYVRVNAPAWIRLVYLLENGARVPVAQGYYIDGGKVNRAVELPDVFEIAPPFGVEHIHATAFSREPEPLPTVSRVYAGTPYQVVADDLRDLVRHRGLQRKSPTDQVAEALLTLTTVPAPPAR